MMLATVQAYNSHGDIYLNDAERFDNHTLAMMFVEKYTWSKKPIPELTETCLPFPSKSIVRLIAVSFVLRIMWPVLMPLPPQTP